VQQLCYEVDVEPYARTRDAAINQLAASAGVQVSAHISHTLYVSRTVHRAWNYNPRVTDLRWLSAVQNRSE
jgi:cryptochrome